MTSILIIEKNASIKSHNIKVFSEDELFKKAGFKSKEGFARQTVWTVPLDTKTYTIELYGKTTGRAGQENKYDFPPPVDSTLFFGACVLVQRNNAGEVVRLTLDVWNTIYEHLFGGFEDIGSKDSDKDSDTDSDKDSDNDFDSRTKAGYVKDGFVVEDDESFDMSSLDECLDECMEEETPIVAKKTAKKPSVKKPKPANQVVIYPEENIKMVLEPMDDETYLGCTDELREEDYV